MVAEPQHREYRGDIILSLTGLLTGSLTRPLTRNAAMPHCHTVRIATYRKGGARARSRSGAGKTADEALCQNLAKVLSKNGTFT